MNSSNLQNKQPSHPSLRPPSPAKRTVALPGIPEARPGPNAFAQQAARMDRHRLETNAFYQQEVRRRRVTPPTATHPAFRSSGNSDSPQPLTIKATDQRESTVTTMSPFINAGRASETSPQLRLMPSCAQIAEPTQRGFIEEQREQMIHEASGSEEERVPVYNTFVPTPKPASTEFANPATTPKKPRISLPKKGVATAEAPKSPKRNFFDRMRMTKLTNNPSPSTATLVNANGELQESDVPPKAQAVLGASPSKTGLTRTPSKQKRGLFALRKVPEVTDVNTSNVSLVPASTSASTDEPLRTASSIAQTPQTAISDPTHYSFQKHTPATSQTFSGRYSHQEQDVGKCLVQRSQSLKYMDSVPPPTPPAKNTPPHEKVKQDAAASKSNRVPFYQSESTPSKGPAGIISTSDRLSPTKFGSYGHKEMPTLVTKPSLYSLHASVVPEMCEATTFEEMKARIDGLGLEGFNMPTENYYSRSPEMVYSPSVYSNDWGARPSIVAKTPRSGHRKTMDDLPTLPEVPGEKDRDSHHTKQSSSSGGTIPIVYPGLASDPSIQDMTPHLHTRSVLDDIDQETRAAAGSAGGGGLPSHGITHSHHHSDSPRHSVIPDALRDQDYEDSPHHKEGISQLDTGSFAISVAEDSPDTYQSSPTSFNHPSAMPSPLHYLPATTYTPPRSKKALGGYQNDATPSGNGNGSGLGIRDGQHSTHGSPPRSNNLLENAPVLTAQPNARNRANSRPSVSGQGKSGVDVDPRKPGTVSDGADKHDQILDMLNKILTQNQDVAAMRNELRNNHARLDERLAAMENVHTSSPTSPTQSYGFDGSSSQHEGNDGRTKRDRVATSFAHDFYREYTTPPSSAGATGNATFPMQSDTIADLQETNRQLSEMVRGFAAKLEEMQRRMDGGS